MFFYLYIETPAGKGYADCVIKPRRKGDPGIVIELKYNRSADEGLMQIEQREYQKAFDKGVKSVLLVSVNYDKKTKKHACRMKKIER